VKTVALILQSAAIPGWSCFPFIGLRISLQWRSIPRLSRAGAGLWCRSSSANTLSLAMGANLKAQGYREAFLGQRHTWKKIVRLGLSEPLFSRANKPAGLDQDRPTEPHPRNTTQPKEHDSHISSWNSTWGLKRQKNSGVLTRYSRQDHPIWSG
jgi:hypothetical protein